METTVFDLKVNETAKIVKIKSLDLTLTKKLLSMGVLKGQDIVVVKKALLGDPIEIKVRGYSLSLRKEEASQIIVEVKK